MVDKLLPRADALLVWAEDERLREPFSRSTIYDGLLSGSWTDDEGSCGEQKAVKRGCGRRRGQQEKTIRRNE